MWHRILASSWRTLDQAGKQSSTWWSTMYLLDRRHIKYRRVADIADANGAGAHAQRGWYRAAVGLQSDVATLDQNQARWAAPGC
jgi:hypothetical protein